MALVWLNGFLVDNSTSPPTLATTTVTTGAKWDGGFLRAPGGALVVR